MYSEGTLTYMLSFLRLNYMPSRAKVLLKLSENELPLSDEPEESEIELYRLSIPSDTRCPENNVFIYLFLFFEFD